MTDDLQSWSEVPRIAHFCSLFRKAFNLLEFDIQDLEEGLLLLEDEEKLVPQLVVKILKGCSRTFTKVVTEENYNKYLRRLFISKADEAEEDNVEYDFECSDLTERALDYEALTLRDRVRVLHQLCEFRLDGEDVSDKVKNLEASSLRVEPLGRDSEGYTYWYFYGTRLYKESSSSGTLDKKKQRKEKDKKKRKKKEKKKKKKSSTSSDEDESVLGGSPSWSVACLSLQDWFDLTEKMHHSKKKFDKDLFLTLSDSFLPEIIKMFADKEKEERRRLQLLAPKRSSSRIESKRAEQEEKDRLLAEKLDEEDERLLFGEDPMGRRRGRSRRRGGGDELAIEKNRSERMRQREEMKELRGQNNAEKEVVEAFPGEVETQRRRRSKKSSSSRVTFEDEEDEDEENGGDKVEAMEEEKKEEEDQNDDLSEEDIPSKIPHKKRSSKKSKAPSPSKENKKEKTRVEEQQTKEEEDEIEPRTSSGGGGEGKKSLKKKKKRSKKTTVDEEESSHPRKRRRRRKQQHHQTTTPSKKQHKWKSDSSSSHSSSEADDYVRDQNYSEPSGGEEDEIEEEEEDKLSEDIRAVPPPQEQKPLIIKKDVEKENDVALPPASGNDSSSRIVGPPASKSTANTFANALLKVGTKSTRDSNLDKSILRKSPGRLLQTAGLQKSGNRPSSLNNTSLASSSSLNALNGGSDRCLNGEALGTKTGDLEEDPEELEEEPKISFSLYGGHLPVDIGTSSTSNSVTSSSLGGKAPTLSGVFSPGGDLASSALRLSSLSSCSSSGNSNHAGSKKEEEDSPESPSRKVFSNWGGEFFKKNLDYRANTNKILEKMNLCPSSGGGPQSSPRKEFTLSPFKKSSSPLGTPGSGGSEDKKPPLKQPPFLGYS